MASAHPIKPRTSEPFHREEMSRIVAASTRLLEWYAATKRPLPWRETHEPYAVWVSEIMLQQTQVATVIPYYQRWMRRFPTVFALADAPQADVLLHWEGLGYYSRARALHAGAQTVVSEFGGNLPSGIEQLQQLPGIGPYTAGAIASIAYGLAVPAVDGNVVRVLSRFFGVKGVATERATRAKLEALAKAWILEGRAGDCNQALMEFGATCCTPKAPRCVLCPLSADCTALASDQVLALPERAPRPGVVQVSHVAIVLEHRGKLLVRQLPDDAPRWAGLWQLPTVECDAAESESSAVRRNLQACVGCTGTFTRIHRLDHAVTRFRISLSLYRVRIATAPRIRAAQGLHWRSLEALRGLAMPAPQRKMVQWLLGAHPDGKSGEEHPGQRPGRKRSPGVPKARD